MIVALHLHGFNVEDYRNTAGKLDDEFDAIGLRSYALVYHADTLREARKINPDTAMRLAEFISDHQSDGDTVIVTAHSNGNTILRMAWDRYKVSPDVAVCIQPALPSDLHPSPGAQFTRVYWNPYDSVVKHGRLLTWITSLFSKQWVADRNWGQMGATGYTGRGNVENVNTVHCPIKAEGHSGIFQGMAAIVHLPLIAKWAAGKARQVR